MNAAPKTDGLENPDRGNGKRIRAFGRHTMPGCQQMGEICSTAQAGLLTVKLT